MAAAIKSDDPTKVGKHPFEAAGLGFAPFVVTGCSQQMTDGQGIPGLSKPCGHCDFCGQHGIRYEFTIRDAFGATFVVGSDCVTRTGDAKLVQGYKNNPEYRRFERERRQAAAKVRSDAFGALMADPATKAKLSTMPHPQGYKDWKTNEPLTAWDWAEWMDKHCMTSGRGKALTGLRKLLGA